MRKKILSFIFLTYLVSLSSCAIYPQENADGGREKDSLNFTILHLNDIYELSPVSGGREGGLARVATLRKQLIEENPNTITVLAGDLFSPSALGTAKVEGERLAGRQMIAVLNTLGLDYITFGNHEFDIREQSFLDRLAESNFTWISANVKDRDNKPFPGVHKKIITIIEDRNKTKVRIGFFGLTVPSNKKDYVNYADPEEAARSVTTELRDQVDILIGLTHLDLTSDILLANLGSIDLILGGHEHENFQVWRGPNFTPIFKADANARTVYIHRITFNSGTKEISVSSELRKINDSIQPDPATQTEIDRWTKLGFDAFRQQGFEPEETVAEIPEPLDGLEAHVRYQQTNLTDLIAHALLSAVPGAQLALYNSGSVRIDDVIPPGPLTQYDILRILPFSGRVCAAVLEGGLLRKILDQGMANRGSGGFLQVLGATKNDHGDWLINGASLNPAQLYRIATNDFLLSGREVNLGFFSTANPKIEATCDDTRDIRLVVSDYLQQIFGDHN